MSEIESNQTHEDIAYRKIVMLVMSPLWKEEGSVPSEATVLGLATNCCPNPRSYFIQKRAITHGVLFSQGWVKDFPHNQRYEKREV